METKKEVNFKKVREIKSVDFNLFDQKQKMEGIENVQSGNDIVYYDNGIFICLDNFRLDKKKYPNGIDFGDGTALFVKKVMKVVAFGSNCFHLYPSPVPELVKTDCGYGFLCRDVSSSYFEKAKKKTAMYVVDMDHGLLLQIVICNFGPAKVNFNPLESEDNVLLIDKKGKQKSLFYAGDSGRGLFLKITEDSKPFPVNQLTRFCLSHLTDEILVSETH